MSAYSRPFNRHLLEEEGGKPSALRERLAEALWEGGAWGDGRVVAQGCFATCHFLGFRQSGGRHSSLGLVCHRLTGHTAAFLTYFLPKYLVIKVMQKPNTKKVYR